MHDTTLNQPQQLQQADLLLSDDVQVVREVASLRVANSDDPARFTRVLASTVRALAAGQDLATKAWTAKDPVRAAAEIEALAGARRLTYRRPTARRTSTGSER